MDGKEKDSDGVTAQQRKFAYEYVNGQNQYNGTKSAIAAGYSDEGGAAHVRANECLNNPNVLNIIYKLEKKRMRANAGKGNRIIETLASEAVSESVRLSAAVELRNGGGLKQAEIIELQDNRNPEQREKRIKELEQMLGNSATYLAETGQDHPDLAEGNTTTH